MKKSLLAWMVGGTLVVAGAFFIPGQAGSIWSSIIWATGAAIAYLVFFGIFWLQRLENQRKRRWMEVALGLLITCSIISASISYISSQRQMSLLSEIRMTLDSNMAEVHMKDPLLKTFREYHLQNNSLGLAQIFLHKYDSLITEDSLYQYMGPDTYGKSGDENDFQIYVEKLQPDSLVLIGDSKVTIGKSAKFKNRSGETGRFQVQAILTREGLYYERIN